MATFIKKALPGIITKFLTLLLIILAQFFFVAPQTVYAAQSRVGMGTADSFAILAGSGITNTGSTTITGDVGTYATTTETGFGSVTINGTNHAGDAVTQGAKTDLITAYNDAAGRGPIIPIVSDLGGQTLTPGVYNSGSSIGLTGTVTLDAQGDPDAVFIFQAGSTLITAPGSSVSLINGAQACDVFWQIGSSATIDTTTSFIGNLFASASITLNTSATVNGRMLARDGAVTMDTNTITVSTCAAGIVGGSSLVSSLTTAGTPSFYYPPLSNQIVAPTILESKRTSPTSISLSWGPYSGTNLFNVQYGLTSSDWLYNTDVTGFSVTLGSLPANQPIWVRVAARNNYTIGSYGESKLIGGPGLPNTGLAERKNNAPLHILTGVFVGISILLVAVRRKRRSFGNL